MIKREALYEAVHHFSPSTSLFSLHIYFPPNIPIGISTLSLALSSSHGRENLKKPTVENGLKRILEKEERWTVIDEQTSKDYIYDRFHSKA